MKPLFLTKDQVLSIHRLQIERIGGSHGVRDHGLLDSAVSMPSSTYGGEFLHSTVFEMAAAYLYHLVMNHPFIDGNKRVGAMAADVFLQVNGYDLQASQEAFERLVLETAQGNLKKDDIARFLKKHSRKSGR